MQPQNNPKYEFNSYELTPNDKYGMIGIATVTINGPVKVVLKYKKTRGKDGKSEFFVSPSYAIESDSGEKRYVNAFFLDSSNENQNLLQFIRDNVNEVERQMSIHKMQRNQSTSSASTTPFIQQAEYKTDDELPF